jgi:hypothetical protein
MGTVTAVVFGGRTLIIVAFTGIILLFRKLDLRKT